MPTVEVSLPDQVNSEIDRLVEQGDFINREQAIEELLSRGLSVQDTPTSEPDTVDEDVFTQAIEDQQDPARLDDADDDMMY